MPHCLAFPHLDFLPPCWLCLPGHQPQSVLALSLMSLLHPFPCVSLNLPFSPGLCHSLTGLLVSQCLPPPPSLVLCFSASHVLVSVSGSWIVFHSLCLSLTIFESQPLIILSLSSHSPAAHRPHQRLKMPGTQGKVTASRSHRQSRIRYPTSASSITPPVQKVLLRTPATVRCPTSSHSNSVHSQRQEDN